MISRRAFLSLAGASAPAFAAPLLRRGKLASEFKFRLSQSPAPQIDAARLRNRIERLSYYGRPPGGTFADGVNRVAYSVADLTARAWLIDEIKGMDVVPRIDAAGNIFARFGGDPKQPAILFGSHIDSVPTGGNFDGDLGTFAAFEVIRAVQAAKLQTRHPLEMVVWAHEESTAFGIGTAASRIVAGDLQAGDMDRVWNGMKRGDAIRKIAGNPDQIETAIRGKGAWHSYVELHIEQGGTLDKAKIPIGIVEGIVAIHRYDVVIEGQINHAGTTPMNERHDAMVAAAQLTIAVRDIASRRQGRQVGTVGRIEIEPNSPNVIPGRATLSVEFRDLSEQVLRELGDAIKARGAEIGKDTGTTVTFTLASTNVPAMAASGVQSAIGRAAAALNLNTMRLPSGAGHDAQQIAKLCPMGMIFVPSVGGISHSPKELTTWEDCANGANVLLRTVLDLDQRDTI
ncbi:MAG TPA: Zn-dependent hydrolase [Vicinamibacterales bacterium]|nr:Zn-dependent hydrolase [Vicinamibacterales bacterium]